MDDGPDLTDAVVRELAARVAQRTQPPWTVQDLQGVVDLAVQILPACDSAGITVTERDEVTTVVTTDEDARRGDELQSQLHEGPCVTSAAETTVVRVIDLEGEQRWPRWRPRAVAEIGVRSMLCVPLFDSDGRAGALNLYSRRAHAFDTRDLATAQALADSTALAVAASQKINQLEHALDTRSMIGQAMGIVMATFRIDEAEAFKLLTRMSNETNVKLAEVARRLLEQHRNGQYLSRR